MQIHTFTVKPGEAIDWYYHRALAYVVIKHGTLSEQHVEGNGACSAWVAFGAGSAFVEEPGDVHRVTNTGKGDAVVTSASRITGLPSTFGANVSYRPDGGTDAVICSAVLHFAEDEAEWKLW